MKLEIPIEIKSTEILDKRGTSRTGKLFHIREQMAYADLGKPYPVEIRVALDAASAPYPAGRYRVHPDTVYVDRFGRLTMGRLRLLPTTTKE